MEYFNHDTDAGSDSKIVALRMFYGHGAIDCYWSLVEQVYRDESPLPDNRYTVGALAQGIGENPETVQEWLEAMVDIGLIEKTERGYSSKRIDENIEEYKSRVEKASKAGKASAAKRKSNKRSTAVQRPLNDRATNKIKENKIKGFAELRSAQQNHTDCGGNGAKECAAAESDGHEDITAEIDEFLRSLPC